MTHLEEAKESQSEHGIAAGLPLPIAYAMEIVQDVAQGILEIQRMSVPDITEVSDHEKESPTARFIREIGESNDRILLNSHLSLSEISPYNIPRWVLQDPNIAPFISKREWYLIGFFENPSAPEFTRGLAYYSGTSLYYIRYRAMLSRTEWYQGGNFYADNVIVTIKPEGTKFQHWDIPEERIPDILDLEKLGKDGWNLTAGVFPLLSE